MVQLSEIDTQDASTLVCSHLICEGCGIIDRDWSRTRGGACATCGKQSASGRLAFPTSLHILADITQQAYHSQANVGPIAGPRVPTIGTVLFYCSLREALLNHFLLNLLHAQGVQDRLIARLMDDNKLASQKFNELFSSVVGQKWSVAVTEASNSMNIDFGPTSQLMIEAAGIRNKFMHEGTGWAASHRLATKCIDNLPLIFELFASLHNTHTHPLISAQQAAAATKSDPDRV